MYCGVPSIVCALALCSDARRALAGAFLLVYLSPEKAAARPNAPAHR